MTISQIEIQIIAVLTAAACALPGVILVLRRMSMLGDAISHTVLLGIVIGFFLTGDMASPLLVIGAAAVGVLTVGLTSLLERTRLVKEDAAIGLVFPALFSIAIILVSRYAGRIHLDTDVVLVGELAFAPFDRLEGGGLDFGPRGLYLMLGILLINLFFIVIFYKELKLTTFDAGLAAALGFAPALLHYAFMGLLSVTIVGAFDIVGSILVVALLIAPPAAAYLLTDRFAHMFVLSALLGGLAAIGGYWLAYVLDASIAGSIAAAAGGIFLLVFLAAPEKGLFSQALRRSGLKWEFAQTMLTIHLFNHENTSAALNESRIDHLSGHLRWDPAFANQVVHRALDSRLIKRHNGHLALTETGRQRAQNALNT